MSQTLAFIASAMTRRRSRAVHLSQLFAKLMSTSFVAQKRRRKLKALVAAAMIAVPSLASAHHPAKTGQHGGPQSSVGPFHIEIVANDRTLDVYLRDHASQPVASSNYTGVANFRDARGRLMRIALEPAGENRLSGEAPGPLSAKFDGALRVTPRMVNSMGHTRQQHANYCADRRFRCLQDVGPQTRFPSLRAQCVIRSDQCLRD